jgi:exonuclease SbcC
VATRATQLRERAVRAEGLVTDAERAERELSARESRARELAESLRALGFDEAMFAAEREAHGLAREALTTAEVALAEARGHLVAAEERLAQAERREHERRERVARIAELHRQHRLHDELDRSFGDLRADLNAQVRPELSDVASTFLTGITDGRYGELLLDEQYRATILEDGVPKPVISGGEEDLANLALRLAISQLVADRAGQPLSLLVLDEIFGSLDEARRQLIVDLLRRLRDRFAQVILITHIESVRESLDRVVRVAYDAATGTSVVVDDAGPLPEGDDEDVAA